MMIAVTGASGQLGALVLERLAAKVPAARIVAIARTPDKVKVPGVALRQADYADPATLAPALAGVETLLLISSSEVGQRAAQHRNVIEAAKRAGVGRIVYTSLLRADTTPLSLAAEHVETEAMLKASGIPYTILRNGWYTENHTGSLGGALAAGALIGSAGTGRIASAARADYADAAVAALFDPALAGRTLELAGDTAWTLDELAAEVSRQTGRAVPYRNLPVADYAAALAEIGLPKDLAGAIAGWDADAANGALFDDGHVLSGLIGRPTTPMAASVAAALKG